MSWQDREYHRGDAGYGGAQFQFGRGIGRKSIVFWLIVINVAVFVVDGVVGRIAGPVQVETIGVTPLYAIGYFSADTAIRGFQIWRFATFQFLHGGLGHLACNMIGLFFFGPMIERYLGSQRFLWFYLLCGFAGAMAYLLLWGSGLVVSASWIPLSGASAGIFGILIAAALIAPNTKVLLYFVLPIPIRVLVWIIVGIAAYVVLAQGHIAGSNAGGQAAHLGGAALGFFLIKNPALLNWANRKIQFVGSAGATPRGGSRWARKQKQQERESAEVDRILSKVKEHGVHSLTRAEKKTMQRATDRQREAG